MLSLMVAQGDEFNLLSILSIVLFLPNWLIRDTLVPSAH